jgi:hypothetical protein
MHDIFIVNYSNGRNVDSLLKRFPHAKIIKPDRRMNLYRTVATQTATKHAWIIDNRYCYDQFNFDYTPEWHQADQIHVWQSSVSKSGNTCLLNAAAFLSQCENLSAVQNYEYICWHKNSVVSMLAIPDVVIWNFGGHDDNLNKLKECYPDAKVLRYFGTHLEMLKKSAAYTRSENFWVLSSCCDYTDFNPFWEPSWEEENSIHCWASGNQKFGDTFYVDKKYFLAQENTIDKLEYFDTIFWHSIGYPRLPWPVNYSTFEDLYTTIKNHRFSTVYEYFVMPGSEIGSTVDPSLWEKRHLIAYNRNGHVSLCPRDCISSILNKVADYPYIVYHNCEKSTETPQDIVFISYDEKDADLNWQILKKQQPTAQRLHGVDGMITALKIAAKTSKTPWFYAVFAKTKVATGFKFDFAPDYLDVPGNYIFHAHNLITDYTYGHGAVLLYHSKTVEDAVTWGYDFTTSFPYTYIPILSCYNDATTPWEAWRTSFREVLKLREMNTIESKYRMHRWLTVGNGTVGKWSIKGAEDAIKYVGSLEKANDWNWLRDYFITKHPQNQ